MVCLLLKPEVFSSVEEVPTLKLPAKLLIKLHLWCLPQAIELKQRLGEGWFSFLRLVVEEAFG